MASTVFTLALLATASFAEAEPQRQHGHHHRGCYRNGRFDSKRCRGSATGSGGIVAPTGTGIISPTGGIGVNSTSFNGTMPSGNATSPVNATSIDALPHTILTRPHPSYSRHTTKPHTTAAPTSSIIVTSTEAPATTYSAPAPAPTTTTTTVAPAPVPSSTTATYAPAPSSPSTTKGKKGLSFTNADVLSAWANTDVAWTYNWWTDRGPVPDNMDYYPMMWCNTKISQSSWTTAVKKAISQGSTRILGANEPDRPDQCNQPDVNDAITGHQDYMNQFKGQVKVGSPAVSNGGAPGGLTYLESFLKGCDGNCTVDFLNVHWYGTSASDFQNHVTQSIALADKYNVPEVFVTEFATTSGSASDKADFVNQVLPWMEGQSKVGGYAYFMASDGILSTGTAISSVLGAAYEKA